MTSSKKDISYRHDGPTSATIQVVRRFHDLCILYLPHRGTGPRALQNWVSQHAEKCFLDYDEEDDADDDCSSHGVVRRLEACLDNRNVGGETERSCDKNNKERKQQETLPVKLVSPHYSAYAQSLVLVARNNNKDHDVTRLQVTVHCLVKGYVKPTTRLKWTSTIDGNEYTTHATTLAAVPSNTAGHVSLLAVHNEPTMSDDNAIISTTTSIAPRQYRRHLKEAGYPVLGSSKDATPFRGESLCMSVVQLDFQTSRMSDYSIHIPPAPKLQTLLEREERFWRERQQKRMTTDSASAETNHSSYHVCHRVAEPSPYTAGRTTFDGLELQVTRNVMIPRKASETVVDRALALYHETHKTTVCCSPTVLDLGTGSGCLLLAILHRMHRNGIIRARGVGVDVSEDALQVARNNSNALGLDGSCHFVHASFLDFDSKLQEMHQCHDSFDIVVCNPPYHTRGGRKILDAESTIHEPDSALFVDNKSDYLVHYRNVLGILTGAEPRLLAPRAVVVFEVFRDNSQGVSRLMKQAGLLERVQVSTDGRGCIRTVEGIFSSSDDDKKKAHY